MAHIGRLSAGLKQRHISMMSIAGVIGAGLFVGSARAIAEAGPAVIVAYFFGGLLAVLVMRMLGEMAVAFPDTGSFSTYADRAIAPWAGFTIGWLYWWFWVLVVPIEATAAAFILNAWFPHVELYIFAFGVTGLFVLSNLSSVRNYGELEFWCALLKVVAIIAFIAVGILAIVGRLPGGGVSGFHGLSQFGGFMPNGAFSVLGALLTTMFSFMGVEIVTIAAAESENPAKQISKAINSVIWRICIFFLSSIFIVICLVPWNDSRLAEVGSYQRALELMNVPYAKMIMDVVVLSAVASCLNSAIYTASRMCFSLSVRGDGPQFLKKTTRKGTPVLAVLFSAVVGFFAILLSYAAPRALFHFLLSTSGAIALLVYLVIAVSQLRMRNACDDGRRYPWLTFGVIIFIVGAFLGMLILPLYRYQLLATALLTSIVVLTGLWVDRRRSHIVNGPVAGVANLERV